MVGRKFKFRGNARKKGDDFSPPFFVQSYPTQFLGG